MYSHRNPYIIGFHVHVCQKDPDKNTSDLLVDAGCQPHIRGGVIEKIKRHMPQSPHNAKKQHTASQSKMFLHHRLEIIPPAIFLSEKRRYHEEEIKKKIYQIYRCIRLCPYCYELFYLSSSGTRSPHSHDI